jgi:hypothetical protein
MFQCSEFSFSFKRARMIGMSKVQSSGEAQSKGKRQKVRKPASQRTLAAR